MFDCHFKESPDFLNLNILHFKSHSFRIDSMAYFIARRFRKYISLLNLLLSRLFFRIFPCFYGMFKPILSLWWFLSIPPHY